MNTKDHKPYLLSRRNILKRADALLRYVELWADRYEKTEDPDLAHHCPQIALSMVIVRNGLDNFYVLEETERD